MEGIDPLQKERCQELEEATESAAENKELPNGMDRLETADRQGVSETVGEGPQTGSDVSPEETDGDSRFAAHDREEFARWKRQIESKADQIAAERDAHAEAAKQALRDAPKDLVQDAFFFGAGQIVEGTDFAGDAITMARIDRGEDPHTFVTDVGKAAVEGNEAFDAEGRFQEVFDEIDGRQEACLSEARSIASQLQEDNISEERLRSIYGSASGARLKQLEQLPSREELQARLDELTQHRIVELDELKQRVWAKTWHSH